MKRVLSRLAMGAALLAIIPAALRAAEHDYPAAAAPAGNALAVGTVKKIDKAAGWVTLIHGPIANLDMPGMTMTFKVKKPKALDGLKEGDKVRFRAEDVGGSLFVVRIEAAK